jgi:hypothetical protein
MRWTPAFGWAPPTGPADPKRFAVASGNYGLYEVDPLKSMFSAGNTVAMGMGAAFGLTRRASTNQQESNGSLGASDAPPPIEAGGSNSGKVFSDPDFDTVASLLQRTNQLHNSKQGSGVEEEGSGVIVTHQWSVLNTGGESGGWQYAFNFTRKHADWGTTIKKTSFCRRRVGK